MIKNISPVNFEARLIFANQTAKTMPKLKSNKSSIAVLHDKKTKEPSWLLKLIFGIKKKTKLPSYKGQ